MMCKVGWVVACSLLIACSEPTKATPAGSSASAESTQASSGSTTEPAAPLPAPESPTHYASATPPPNNAACAPLPAVKNDAAPLAAILRRLSCEPALYYLTSDKLRAELALPADIKLEFAGESAVSLSFPKLPARDLAAAMGVDKPVAVRSNAGAWGYRVFNLATEGKERPDIWGPGRVTVGVGIRYTDVADSVDSVPIGDAQLAGHASVAMPEEVLPVVDDQAAVATLRAALAFLAANPSLLAKEPEEVAKLAGLSGDRFRVSRRSIGTGPDAIKGIDIWAARTRVPAGEVIDAVGAKGRIKHNEAHDSDDFLLYDRSRSAFPYRSLEVTLSFDERPGKEAAGPHGKYVLGGVFLMPAR